MKDELALEDDVRLIQRLGAAERIEVRCGELHRDEFWNIPRRVEKMEAVRTGRMAHRPAQHVAINHGLLKPTL